MAISENTDSATDIGWAEISRILKRRKALVAGITAGCLALAAILSFVLPKKWDATAEMVLLQRVPTRGSADSPDYAAPIEAPVATQVAVLGSAGLATRTQRYLASKSPSGALPPEAKSVEDLQRAITVTNPKGTDLMDVSVRAGSRANAITMADAVCHAFMGWKQDAARNDLHIALDALNKQAEASAAKLDTAEQAQARYQEAAAAPNATAEFQTTSYELQSRDAQAANLQQDLQSAEARADTLRQQLVRDDSAISKGDRVRDDGLILSLQNQLNTLEIQRADQARRVTALYPGVLPGLDSKIADLRTRLTQAVHETVTQTRPSLQHQSKIAEDYRQAQVMVGAARARLNAALELKKNATDRYTEAKAERLKSAAHDTSSNLTASRLARAVEEADAQYRTDTGALAAAHLNSQEISGNVQVTQMATALDQAAFPNLPLNLLIGGALGLFLSVVAAVSAERGGRRTEGVEGILELLDGPVVGALPVLSSDALKAVLSGETPERVEEAFGFTYANIALSAQRRSGQETARSQIVVVTSAVAGEGKSLTALELGRSFARAGRSVVLVDANLRSPSLHNVLAQDVRGGLSDVLSGATPIGEVITPTTQNNLFLVAAGTSERRPGELLAQPALTTALSELRSAFDLIVIDTPSVLYADAILLSAHADRVIQVIDSAVAGGSQIMAATAALQGTSSAVIAYFLNRSDISPAGLAARGAYHLSGQPVLTDSSHGSADAKKAA